MKRKSVIFVVFVMSAAIVVLWDNWKIATQAWIDLWNSDTDMALAAVSSSSQTAVSLGIIVPKPALASCWPNESSDLNHLAGLLETSNAEIAALTAKLPSRTSDCSATVPSVPSENSGKDPSTTVAMPADISPMPSDKLICNSSSFDDKENLTQEITLNEIAWMGSPPAAGESAAKAANLEWIELKNNTDKAINLSGWQIADPSGKIQIFFDPNDSIPAHGLYLLSRGNGADWEIADKVYSGVLANSGDVLAIFSPDCGISDLIDGSGGWPGGNNTTKQTLERKIDGTWQTSARPGGTPKIENSTGLARYRVDVAIQGDGAGKITSKPSGIFCNSVLPGSATCSAEFFTGTVVTLTATAAKDAKFDSWSGGCGGPATCSFSVNGPISVVATFKSGLSEAASELLNQDSTDSTASSSPENSTSSLDPVIPLSGPAHVVIDQVQTAGAVSSNDFVKIFNPTGGVIDLNGWKLRKRSGSGVDYSLRVFPSGTSISAGEYLTWANASDGFAGSINADFSSSENLAGNNSVALLDAAGNLVDAVAWGTGTNQYVEGLPYPTNPAANQILQRRRDDISNPIDTNNNADDFSL